ncbi:hypothetical protein PFUGPA_01200 [Plasmodium falciparum Palo Alto/Uganda]|uniref:Uncharacterized protein n=1 Tax=Plasmodium falciparum (isolate Palo Alto / Uganda) TaxID=57270 RepID=W4J3J7_PLAFP|nr:hypothetical protein PFUGPA_01200 [Plasmodium falciparum Palo Alto/Uganda]
MISVFLPIVIHIINIIGNLKQYIDINNLIVTITIILFIKSTYLKSIYYNVIILLIFYINNIKYNILVCRMFGKYFKIIIKQHKIIDTIEGIL